ncbi:hypothetical protein B0H11DRAFT_2263864 [Mycena galericulata]|nr:hypothetical protein B0H11DRAFT_2263864 [Mycena galericulata]
MSARESLCNWCITVLPRIVVLVTAGEPRQGWHHGRRRLLIHLFASDACGWVYSRVALNPPSSHYEEYAYGEWAEEGWWEDDWGEWTPELCLHPESEVSAILTTPSRCVAVCFGPTTKIGVQDGGAPGRTSLLSLTSVRDVRAASLQGSALTLAASAAHVRTLSTGSDVFAVAQSETLIYAGTRAGAVLRFDTRIKTGAGGRTHGHAQTICESGAGWPGHASSDAQSSGSRSTVVFVHPTREGWELVVGFMDWGQAQGAASPCALIQRDAAGQVRGCSGRGRGSVYQLEAARRQAQEQQQLWEDEDNEEWGLLGGEEDNTIWVGDTVPRGEDGYIEEPEHEPWPVDYLPDPAHTIIPLVLRTHSNSYNPTRTTPRGRAQRPGPLARIPSPDIEGLHRHGSHSSQHGSSGPSSLTNIPPSSSSTSTISARARCTRSASPSTASPDGQKHHVRAPAPPHQGQHRLRLHSGDLKEIRNIIIANKVAAPARAGGTFTPKDVTVPAGNTGIEPGKTSFFHTLGIPTKIPRGIIEIVSDVKVVAGTRGGTSEVTLHNMPNISPFTYRMSVVQIFDSGDAFSPLVLDVDEQKPIDRFLTSIKNITALSLALKYRPRDRCRTPPAAVDTRHVEVARRHAPPRG